MARVFDTPRYKDQTLLKVKFISSHDPGNSLYEEALLMPKIHSLRKFNIPIFDLDELTALHDTFDIPKEHRYAYRESLMSRVEHSTLSQFAKHLNVTIRNGKPILCDYSATFGFMKDILSTNVITKIHNTNKQILNHSEAWAIDDIAYTLTGAKVGSRGTRRVLNEIVRKCDQSFYNKNIHDAAEFCEEFLLTGASSNIRDSHSELMSGGRIDIKDIKSFRYMNAYAAVNKSAFKVYNFLGLKVVVTAHTNYVFDHSSCEQLYTCMRFWSNMLDYSVNYRITGDSKRESKELITRAIIHWVCEQDTVDHIARHMKSSYAILQNEIHIEYENAALKGEERTAALVETLDKLPVNGVTFYELIKNLDCSWREKMDFAYALHGMPAADCDAEVMFRAFTNKLSNSNAVEDLAFNRFMDYSKTMDLVLLTKKIGDKVLNYVNCSPGYIVFATEWFAKLLRGADAFPPEAEIGKAWLTNYFPFSPHMNYWHWEAADVTRVEASFEFYNNIEIHQNAPKYYHNELLYALKKAPFINHTISPDELRKQICDGDYTADVICTVAAKSENTKFGPNVRETYSGDNALREVTSEYDRTAIGAVNLGKSAALRMNPVTFNKKISNINNYTTPNMCNRTTIISLDVSGWSPNANREYVFRHHEYVASLTKIPAGYNIKEMWSRIRLIINKRGDALFADAPSGMFQGFTGTLDTALHQHMLFFAVRECKRRGILEKNEAAHGLCLIDDGVIALSLSSDRTADSINVTCRAFCETIIDVYKSVGYIIDPVKTVCSNIKFTFLNRMYMHGNEIMTPMKVVCKIDREHNRKFVSLNEQIGTVFGSAHSSVLKGADPVYAYYRACARSAQLMTRTSKRIHELNSTEFFALMHFPASTGCIGAPTLLDWGCSEVKDKISHIISTSFYLMRSVSSLDYKDGFARVIHNFFEQAMSEELNLDVLRSPRKLRYHNVIHPKDHVVNIVKDCVRKYATSTEFIDALDLEENPEYAGGIIKYVKEMIIDASILEEFMDTLPTAAISSLFDKSVRNELVNILVPSKKKSMILYELRRKDKQRLNTAIDTARLRPENVDHRFFDGLSAYDYAVDLRRRFFSSCGLNVTNHTLCDPVHLLNRTIDENAYSVRVHWDPIKSSVIDHTSTDSNQYNNMYDGVSASYPGYVSKGTISLSAPEYRTLDKVSQRVVRLIALVKFVSSNNGNSAALWELGKACWGSAGYGREPAFTKLDVSDLSSKRLGGSTTSKNHVCAMYANNSASVTVDASNLGSWLDSNRFHIDYMSIVICARISGLLERSTTNNTPPDLYYDVAINSCATSDGILCNFNADCNYSEILKGISGSSAVLTGGWFNKAVSRFSSEDEQEFTGEMLDFELKMQPICVDSVAVGQACRMFDSLGTKDMYLKSDNHTPKEMSEGDMHAVERTFSAESMFAKLCRTMPRDNALVSTVSKIAAIHGNKQIPNTAYLCNWKDAESAYTDIFGTMHPNVVFKSIKHLNPQIASSDLAPIFHTLSVTTRRALAGYTDTEDPLRKRACVIYYLISKGRMPSHLIYRSIALSSVHEIRKSWKFAQQRQIKRERMTRKDPHLDEITKNNLTTIAHYKASLYAMANGALINSRTDEETVLALFKSFDSANTSMMRKTRKLVLPIFFTLDDAVTFLELYPKSKPDAQRFVRRKLNKFGLGDIVKNAVTDSMCDVFEDICAVSEQCDMYMPEDIITGVRTHVSEPAAKKKAPGFLDNLMSSMSGKFSLTETSLFAAKTTEAPANDHFKNNIIAQLYIAGNQALAIKVFTGDEPPFGTIDNTMDEFDISEALEFCREQRDDIDKGDTAI